MGAAGGAGLLTCSVAGVLDVDNVSFAGVRTAKGGQGFVRLVEAACGEDGEDDGSDEEDDGDGTGQGDDHEEESEEDHFVWW